MTIYVVKKKMGLGGLDLSVKLLPPQPDHGWAEENEMDVKNDIINSVTA